MATTFAKSLEASMCASVLLPDARSVLTLAPPAAPSAGLAFPGGVGGLGAPPFVFSPVFPLFFGPLLVEGVHAVNCFGAILWLKPLRFSIAQVAKLLCGIGRPTLALKTSNDNATSVTPPFQIPTSIWA